MIVKKEYKSGNLISSTLIDDVEKIDTGTYDNGISFINVYKRGRKKEDDFETIDVNGINVYIENDKGETLQILRSKKER